MCDVTATDGPIRRLDHVQRWRQWRSRSWLHGGRVGGWAHPVFVWSRRRFTRSAGQRSATDQRWSMAYRLCVTSNGWPTYAQGDVFNKTVKNLGVRGSGKRVGGHMTDICSRWCLQRDREEKNSGGGGVIPSLPFLSFFFFSPFSSPSPSFPCRS